MTSEVEQLAYRAFHKHGGVLDLTPEHIRFYLYWARKFGKGTAVDVGDNLAYLYTGAWEIARRLRGNDRFSLLQRLYEEYREQIDSDPVLDIVRVLISNCYVEQGELDAALAALPEYEPICPDRPGGVAWAGNYSIWIAAGGNYRANLKRHLGYDADMQDLYSILRFGNCQHEKDWRRFIHVEMTVLLSEWQNTNSTSLLRAMAEHPTTPVDNHTELFTASTGCVADGGRNLVEPVQVALRQATFGRSAEFERLYREMRTRAEVVAREKCGIPPKGEGWPSEAVLFHEIRTRFPGHVVQHNAKPVWLAPQHLDIYFPEANLGVEFQGAQHDSPVEFFGGEAALEKRRELDARKREKCACHGCRLLFVRPGYDIQVVENDIRTALRESGRAGTESASPTGGLVGLSRAW